MPWGQAQEISVASGALASAHPSQSSYVWQIEYRQEVLRNFAGSVSWINEGHRAGHHRDGTAWQAWARRPFFRDRFDLSLGVGAYFFFDTQPLAGGDTADVHGASPIFSAAATAYISDRGFLRIAANRVSPSQSTKVTMATIGVGYWLGGDTRPSSQRTRPTASALASLSESEFTVFAGKSVVNTYSSEEAIAGALEYRRALSSHLEWTMTFLHEGDPQIIRRSGFAAQIFPTATFFDQTLSLGFGVGPYFFLEGERPVGGPRSFGVAPLLSPTVSVRLSRAWMLRLVWDRVICNYNRDADVFLIGMGRRWR